MDTLNSPLHQSLSRLNCQTKYRRLQAAAKELKKINKYAWVCFAIWGQCQKYISYLCSRYVSQLCFFFTHTTHILLYRRRGRCLLRNIKQRQTYNDRPDNVGKTSQTIKYTHVFASTTYTITMHPDISKFCVHFAVYV